MVASEMRRKGAQSRYRSMKVKAHRRREGNILATDPLEKSWMRRPALCSWLTCAFRPRRFLGDENCRRFQHRRDCEVPPGKGSRLFT